MSARARRARPLIREASIGVSRRHRNRSKEGLSAGRNMVPERAVRPDISPRRPSRDKVFARAIE
jgi:hypothetical protein